MGRLSIDALKTNHLKNPLGHALGECPRLSWVVEGNGDARGLLTRVQVSEDEGFKDIVHEQRTARWFGRRVLSAGHPAQATQALLLAGVGRAPGRRGGEFRGVV